MSFCKTFYFKNRKYKKIKHKKEKPKDNKKKKKTVTYKGTSNGTSVNFSEVGQETVGWYIQSNERKKQ